MDKLVVTEFISLDGIVEDPAGEWVGQFEQGAEAGAFKWEETMKIHLDNKGLHDFFEMVRGGAEGWDGSEPLRRSRADRAPR